MIAPVTVSYTHLVVSVIPGADRRFCEDQVLLRSSLVDVEQFAAITSIVMVGCSCYILSGFGIVVYLVGITVLVAFVIIIVVVVVSVYFGGKSSSLKSRTQYLSLIHI